MEPRPVLDVDNLSVSRELRSERKRILRRILNAWISAKEREQARNVLRKYRRRQERQADGYETDPNPYDPEYIFYCLETSGEV